MKYKEELDFEYNKTLTITFIILTFSSFFTSYTLMSNKNFLFGIVAIMVGIGFSVGALYYGTKFERSYKELKKKLK